MGDGRAVFIVEALRTPIGRYGGALAEVRPDDLAAHIIAALVDRSGVDPSTIDDVILGCANQAGEDNRNVARMAALLAGLPIEVGGQTVNRLCGSGLQAINSAAHAIMAGDGDAFVAGGVESMTRAPYVMAKAENASPALPITNGARVIDSTPPAMANSISPARIARAASPTALSPEAHRRFTVTPGM